MRLKSIMLSEINQTEKDGSIIVLICGIKKKQTGNKLVVIRRDWRWRVAGK